MDYVIVSLPKDKSSTLGKIVQDDLVSRQTIAVREGEGLGLESENTFVLVEGSEESLEKVKELVGDGGEFIEGDDKKEIYDKIKEAEEKVAEGLGMMFS
mgnify:CR=1 FL=1